MLCHIIDGKIAALNTPTCDIILPDEMIGTHHSRWLYVDGEWSEDPDWVNHDLNPDPPEDFP